MIHWDRQSRHELRKRFSMKDIGFVPRTYKIPLIKHKIISKSIESKPFKACQQLYVPPDLTFTNSTW